MLVQNHDKKLKGKKRKGEVEPSPVFQEKGKKEQQMGIFNGEIDRSLQRRVREGEEIPANNGKGLFSTLPLEQKKRE